MINNKTCPYCRKPMIKAENKPNSRSVEHLIPNAVFTRKRKNNEGDFYACRKCNSRKSNIDYILGVVAKSQASSTELSSQSLIDAISKDDGASKRFIQMVATAREFENEVHMNIPIKGIELIKYIQFLGMGQYFKKEKTVYNPNKFVMEILFANKTVTKALENAYYEKHESNPFRDLEENLYSEIINDGECIIYSKKSEYMFVFHDYTVVTVRVLKRNRKNILKTKKKIYEIIQGFK